jgi:hypothetical protein
MIKNGIKKVPVVLAVLTISACASHPDKIGAAYVSPLKYKDFDCDQIALEMDYVGQRTTTLYQNLKRERTADNWQMGVGLILFWPTLFALEGGDGPEAAEYSQLKGEYEVLRTTSVQKKCSIDALSPEEIMQAAQKDEKDEAIEVVQENEAQHVDDVKKIAEQLNCRELVSLKEVTEKTEIWALGCSDGRTIEVHCQTGTCWVREIGN